MTEKYNLFDEDAHLSEEALALYVDALNLNKAYLLPSAVLGHVSDCEECKSEIVEGLSLVEERAHSSIEPHPYFAKKAGLLVAGFSRAYRVAAVLLIGISIGILFHLFKSMNDSRSVLNVPPAPMQIAHTESGNGPKKENGQVGQQKDFADNFSESPNLEDFVNSTSRSASSIVVSPKNGAVVNHHILFEWKTQKVGSITLKILSNKEKVLKSVRFQRSNFLFDEKLNAGLYYWKLESKDELLYVGKFFVK